MRWAWALIALTGCGDLPAPSIDAPGMAPLIRPDTPGNNLMFNFEPTDVVETHGSTGGRFLVHFTRDGMNAVPAADNDMSGIPDFVEQVADVYDEVLAHYQSLGFRAPPDDGAISDNGGDDRFDVYLVDFAGIGDGNFQRDACRSSNPEICAGYMIQENDYTGYGYPSTLVANRILGSHEFFHAVQAGYDAEQGSVLGEGSAVWATESFDPSLGDFEAFLDGYLLNPDRPLDQPLPGPVDPFSYGSAIFFQFLEERHGPGMVLALWERCENGANGVADPQWFEELDAMLTAEAGASFGDVFGEFVQWNLYTTSSFADPSIAYAAGAGYPRVRIDDVATPHQDDALRVFYASAQYYGAAPAGRPAMTAALVSSGTDAEDLELLLAVESSAGIQTVLEVADPTAGTETVETSSAGRLVTVVLNPLQGGESKKPGLCIGTVEEVSSCRDMLLGVGGAGGAGGGGAPPDDVPPPEDEGGCGCRLAPAPRSPWAAIGVALYFLRRRKRASKPSAR